VRCNRGLVSCARVWFRRGACGAGSCFVAFFAVSFSRMGMWIPFPLSSLILSLA